MTMTKLIIEDEVLASQAKIIWLQEENRRLVRMVAALSDSDFGLFATNFVNVFATMAGVVHKNAADHGWWDTERNDGEMIALMHSELSEALEYIRHGNPPDNHCPEFNGAVTEFADVIIRVMDVCHARGWPLAEAILAKHEYNVKRPHMHGGKKF